MDSKRFISFILVFFVIAGFCGCSIQDNTIPSVAFFDLECNADLKVLNYNSATDLPVYMSYENRDGRYELSSDKALIASVIKAVSCSAVGEFTGAALQSDNTLPSPKPIANENGVLYKSLDIPQDAGRYAFYYSDGRNVSFCISKDAYYVQNGYYRLITDGGLSDIDITGNEDFTAVGASQDMFRIADNPNGNYKLISDIDMNSADSWVPVDFYGSLDGNGFTIRNMAITRCGINTAKVYDGNMKEYDTHFSALFNILYGKVSNLGLNNSIYLKNDTDCVFAAPMAGFLEGGNIENCNITSTVYLNTKSKCFGTGGIAGYGRGKISKTSANVCLISIDSNREEKDEQFMGGAYAAGYIDLQDCNITISGYDSDHGYVHNGGLVGMYIHYNGQYRGNISGCNVNGMITFFEDNRDRRAYCAPFVGEMMNWDLDMNGNSQSFIRNEVYDYSKDLLPDWFSI